MLHFGPRQLSIFMLLLYIIVLAVLKCVDRSEPNQHSSDGDNREMAEILTGKFKLTCLVSSTRPVLWICQISHLHLAVQWTKTWKIQNWLWPVSCNTICWFGSLQSTHLKTVYIILCISKILMYLFYTQQHFKIKRSSPGFIKPVRKMRHIGAYPMNGWS